MPKTQENVKHTTATQSKFRCWYDGPITEAWMVYFRRYQVSISCSGAATEDEVRAHVTKVYSAYGPVTSVNRVPVPAYCAKQPAAVCP